MKSTNNIPTSGPADWLNERQQKAQQILSGLRRDCEELDHNFVVYEKEFETKINRIKTAWEDAVRSRSSENEKRQLLESLRVRLQNIRTESQKHGSAIGKLEERNKRMDQVLGDVDTLEKLRK